MSRATHYLSVTVGLIMLGLLGLAGADEPDHLGRDLVVNGSFEEGEGRPASWGWASSRSAKGSLAIDTDVAHSGVRSVRLHSDSGYAAHVYSGLSQRVRGIAPRGEYLIRAWAKGKSVGTCWFGGGPMWHTRTSIPRGDFDWTLVEMRWTSEGNAPFELRVNVDSNTEALWIDDVRSASSS